MEALRVRIRRRSDSTRPGPPTSGGYHISRSGSVAWATAKYCWKCRPRTHLR